MISGLTREEGLTSVLAGLGAVIKAHPILFAISALLAVVPIAVKAFKEFHKTTKELIETADAAYQVIEETSDKIKQQASSVDELSESYVRLSEGVDYNGSRDSDHSYSKYREHGMIKKIRKGAQYHGTQTVHTAV